MEFWYYVSLSLYMYFADYFIPLKHNIISSWKKIIMQRKTIHTNKNLTILYRWNLLDNDQLKLFNIVPICNSWINREAVSLIVNNVLMCNLNLLQIQILFKWGRLCKNEKSSLIILRRFFHLFEDTNILFGCR